MAQYKIKQCAELRGLDPQIANYIEPMKEILSSAMHFLPFAAK
jgi:hypothetical protein